MATISKPFTFSAGATIVASEHNSNFDTIISDYNGNITNANIAAAAAIAGSKLATITENDKVNATAFVVTSEAQGDIIYFNGTNWVRLGAGTDGQALTTQGASANPTWSGMTTRGDMEYRNATDRARLAVGTANQVVRSDGTDPAWIALSGLMDNVFSSTQGVILYRGGSAWAALATGTNGDVLTTGGAGANPSWAGAGAWIFVETVPLSGNGTDSATLPTTSDTFMLILEDCSSTDNDLIMRFNGDATAGAYRYATLATATWANVSATAFTLSPTATDVSGVIIFKRTASATNGHAVSFQVATDDVADTLPAARASWTVAGAITYFGLARSAAAGTVAGQVHVYRLSKQ